MTHVQQPLQIGVLLFDDVEELDAVGPWEVLAFWAAHVADQPIAVTAISGDGGDVRCAKGLRIGAEHSFATMPRLDVLVHPGGAGARRLASAADHLAWVRQQATQDVLLASVCTGALVLAAAGLLRNRPATTHWRALDALQQLDPSITIRADARFVDDGDVVTSAGVSAGIDMALHLVGRLGDQKQRDTVRRGIQFEPV
jgi:transcriptional regulator GlxA family with amidase domain